MELKERSADATEGDILETMIDGVQEVVRVTAPVFYNLACNKKQEEQNILKDPTKISIHYRFELRRLI